MSKAETHLLGSVDGYRTLSKSSGLTRSEEGELTVLNFGQAEASDMALMRAHPTAHGRVLPGGRYALTRYLPAGVDDAGRPTIELRTLVMGVEDFIRRVRGRLAAFIRDPSIWESEDFRKGRPITLPAPVEAQPSEVTDYVLLDAVHATAGGKGFRLVKGAGQADGAVLHMVSSVAAEEVPGLRWGVSLLSVGVDAGIGTLLPGRRHDGRRQIQECELTGPIRSAAIQASLDTGNPPTSRSVSHAPVFTTADSAPWDDVEGYVFEDAVPGVRRVPGKQKRAGRSSGGVASASRMIMLLAVAVVFFFLVVGSIVTAILISGSGRETAGVIQVREYIDNPKSPYARDRLDGMQALITSPEAFEVEDAVSSSGCDFEEVPTDDLAEDFTQLLQQFIEEDSDLSPDAFWEKAQCICTELDTRLKRLNELDDSWDTTEVNKRFDIVSEMDWLDGSGPGKLSEPKKYLEKKFKDALKHAKLSDPERQKVSFENLDKRLERLVERLNAISNVHNRFLRERKPFEGIRDTLKAEMLPQDQMDLLEPCKGSGDSNFAQGKDLTSVGRAIRSFGAIDDPEKLEEFQDLVCRYRAELKRHIQKEAEEEAAEEALEEGTGLQPEQEGDPCEKLISKGEKWTRLNNIVKEISEGRTNKGLLDKSRSKLEQQLNQEGAASGDCPPDEGMAKDFDALLEKANSIEWVWTTQNLSTLIRSLEIRIGELPSDGAPTSGADELADGGGNLAVKYLTECMKLATALNELKKKLDAVKRKTKPISSIQSIVIDVNKESESLVWEKLKKVVDRLKDTKPEDIKRLVSLIEQVEDQTGVNKKFESAKAVFHLKFQAKFRDFYEAVDDATSSALKVTHQIGVMKKMVDGAGNKMKSSMEEWDGKSKPVDEPWLNLMQVSFETRSGYGHFDHKFQAMCELTAAVDVDLRSDNKARLENLRSQLEPLQEHLASTILRVSLLEPLDYLHKRGTDFFSMFLIPYSYEDFHPGKIKDQIKKFNEYISKFLSEN